MFKINECMYVFISGTEMSIERHGILVRGSNSGGAKQEISFLPGNCEGHILCDRAKRIEWGPRRQWMTSCGHVGDASEKRR